MESIETSCGYVVRLKLYFLNPPVEHALTGTQYTSSFPIGNLGRGKIVEQDLPCPCSKGLPTPNLSIHCPTVPDSVSVVDKNVLAHEQAAKGCPSMCWD